MSKVNVHLHTHGVHDRMIGMFRQLLELIA